MIWKQVLGYEGIYSISEYGDVKREGKGLGCQVGKIRKPQRNIKGYLCISLNHKRNKKTFFVSKLVALNFIGERPIGFQINHIDGNKENNHYKNLEYISPSENVRHAWKIGLNTPVSGMRSGHAKLTDQQVLEIRRRYQDDGITQASLAEIYGVNQTNIGFIVRREHWRHI